ncbi:hypothetical protein [Haloplanus halophilus]|uniref:hypothetical protein n=1 Tax=Haloplanus halophilus TaxID=2949993 RepID=UPI00203FE7EC|nr:hypothetical protein [Haloplanus sp. GDY1]
MVDSGLSDGVRIAQLLASDLVGHEDRLAAVTVTDSDPDVEPTADGRRAYVIRADGDPLATAFVHPERARLEFRTANEAVVGAADDAGLRVRPKAVDPPRTVVFVEDGAEVKRALGVVEAAVAASGDR